MFLDLGQGILDNALQGYNATLLAYGQTGSGKSYSMVGYGANKGLIPTLCERLFQSIRSMQDSRQCQVCQLSLHNTHWFAKFTLQRWLRGAPEVAFRCLYKDWLMVLRGGMNALTQQ